MHSYYDLHFLLKCTAAHLFDAKNSQSSIVTDLSQSEIGGKPFWCTAVNNVHRMALHKLIEHLLVGKPRILEINFLQKRMVQLLQAI
jgi:hypothetical protein